MALFVGNLSKAIGLSDLRDEFEKFGKCRIKIPKVMNFHFITFLTNKIIYFLQDNFAFVDYEVDEEAQAALDALDGKEIC